MSTRSNGKLTKDVVAGIVRGPRRSPLFHWMVENHADLALAARSGSLSWSHLCSAVDALGLTDRSGNPPTPGTARKTWYRARAVVQRMAALEKKLVPGAVPAVHPPMRSVAPAGPLAVTPVAADLTAPASRYPPGPVNMFGETEAEAEVRTEANLARLQQHFDRSAGRVPQEGT